MKKIDVLRKEQKELSFLLLSCADFSKIPVYIIFSYLGARICYSSAHPLLLFSEKKFKNPDKFREFLIFLKKMKHYSIFAHTPVLVRIDKLNLEEKFLLASTFFKVFWHKKNLGYALFNLRHFAEILDDKEFEKIISVTPLIEKIKVNIIKGETSIFNGILSEVPQELFKENKNLFVEPEIIILENAERDETEWKGVIVHNFSRIFSHQFVRHTWLNFNQRSHRYTKIDSFVVPDSFNNLKIENYKKVIENCLELYHDLIKTGIKPEDARFLTPQGCATTVFATGPEIVWQDFIEKRNIPQAQSEIRKLALVLNKIFFSDK